MKRLHRQNGPLDLELIPELGGAISKLTWHGREILRSLPDGQNVTVNQGGCFPLVPYSNRIAHGRFHFTGCDYALLRNFGDHPHPIHGNGWQQPWQEGDADDDSVVLTLHHGAQGASAAQWPWPYRATQRFTLQENALHIVLTYHNLADHAVPAGLGFHPYFPRAAHAEIQFDAGGVVLNDHKSLPTGLAPVPTQWNYLTWRKPQPASVDNCFHHWNGCARVRWPDEKLMVTLSSPDAPHAILFLPPADRDFIAIEPVTHINDAINNGGFGDPALAMATMPANGQLQISMLLEVSHYA